MKLYDPPKKLRKEDYELLADFRYHLRQFLGFSEEAALSIGLTPQQHQALLAVIGFPGRDRITIGELAERLRIKHHSAVGLVDRMISQGLLVREESAEDHRQVYVHLTPSGLDKIEKLSQAHRWELAQIGRGLRELLEQIEKVSY
jgi:DNA-binding MarR family transcriptional regulator